MRIYPAVDMKDGQCVRLRQGLSDQVTVYGEDPAATARRWADQGAEVLHVVDLDGAFTGRSANLEAVSRMAAEVSIPIQLGGGIRTMADIVYRLETVGVARVILGTMLVEQPEIAREAARRYPGRIVAGIDAKGGRMTTRGWVHTTDLLAVDLAKRCLDWGCAACVYTDIAQDGMLTGPNVAETANMVRIGLPIIASGGVGSLDHIRAVMDVGVEGCIVGKALYDGQVSLADALALTR